MAKKATKKDNTKQTIEAMRADLEQRQQRLGAFEEIIEAIDRLIHDKMTPRVLLPSHYETYTDENGEEQRKYIWTEYEEDEEGNTIYDAPDSDDWRYNSYVALLGVKAEIISLL